MGYVGVTGMKYFIYILRTEDTQKPEIHLGAYCNEWRLFLRCCFGTVDQ